MRAFFRLAALITAVAVPAVASAQDEPFPEAAPEGAAPPPAAAPPPSAAAPIAPVAVPETAVAAQADLDLDHGVATDPNIDRTFLLQTAQTQPKGSVSFNDYELVYLGLTYGVTNDFQITATTMVPLGGDVPFFGGLGGKLRVVKSGRLRVSAQGTIYLTADEETYTAGTLGGIGSLCLDDGCESLISASVEAGFAISADSDGITPLVYGASLVQKVSKRIKLVAEVVSGGTFGSDELELVDGALVNYGIRFHGHDIAGDIGFIKPIVEGYDDDILPMGFPFVSFTYRVR